MLALQSLQALRVGVGFGRQAGEHTGALFARLLQLHEIRALLLLQLGELGVLRLHLLVEVSDGLHVVLDVMDLIRTRTAEVAVVDEHAAGALRILLIQKELQRLLLPDEVGGAQLSRQCTAVLRQIGFPRLLLRGKRGALGGAFRAAAADPIQALPRLPDRELRARSSLESRSFSTCSSLTCRVTRSISDLTACSSASVFRASASGCAAGHGPARRPPQSHRSTASSAAARGRQSPTECEPVMIGAL